MASVAWRVGSVRSRADVGARPGDPEAQVSLEACLPLLARTPEVLDTLLRGLPPEWITATEGADTWSPYDVVGHLIHGERTDWMPRVEHLLEYGESVPFPVFDRFAQLEASRGMSLDDLLDTLLGLRQESLAHLTALQLTPADLERRGRHPEFGVVTLGQHLATWVAHDLDHLVQVSRVMASRLAGAVGPWQAYLRVLRRA